MPTTIEAATTRCCRWPLADPDDHLCDPAGFPMCGAPTVAAGKPYCRRHATVAGTFSNTSAAA